MEISEKEVKRMLTLYQKLERIEMTKDIKALKVGLDVAGPNREWWLKEKVFPAVLRYYPWGIKEVADFIGFTLDEFQEWNWMRNCINQ